MATDTEAVQGRAMNDECPLSVNEIETLRMLAAGLTTSQIARRLMLGPTAITNRVSRAARKLGTTTTVNTVLVAFRRGYLAESPYARR